MMETIHLTITLAEFSSLNRRVGFLEGCLSGLRYADDLDGALDKAEERYREICELPKFANGGEN